MDRTHRANEKVPAGVDPTPWARTQARGSCLRPGPEAWLTRPLGCPSVWTVLTPVF